MKIIAVRLRAFLPRIIRRYLFEVPSGFEKTQTYCNIKGLSFFLVRSQEKKERNVPETPEAEVHWKFCLNHQLNHIHPDVWAAEIPHPYVISQDAHILTHERLLLVDGSYQLGLKNFEDHTLFKNYITIPKYKYLPGTSTVVSGPGANRYFHWLLDALPRIGILHQGGFKLSEIDNFLIPKNKLNVVEESLKILGIDYSCCQELHYSSCIQTENLILPSMPGRSGKPAPWVRDFLRNSFLKVANEIPNAYPRRFFISRKETRRVLNESEILPVLQKYGIESVQPEKLSFLEQVALFARAELVVAPHGAALANLIFSPPTTSVIELFSPNYVNVCFWWVARLGGLRYSYLEGEGDRPPKGYDPSFNRDNILVSPERLKSWLDTWF
ncbi:MAG: DUF563 domain-containing protein [Xenococcus sp. (in: cyanobacteria)]